MMRVARFFGLMLCWVPMAASAIGWSGDDLNGRPCTGERQGYGPYDYTNPSHVRAKLGIVESRHFTTKVERLVRGNKASLFGDLDYTLRAFPNHHRALYAMIRLVTVPRKNTRHDGKITTPPECYLQRAMRFQPSDGQVRLLYGIYLHRLKNYQDAEPHYRDAVKLMPKNPEAHYNLALMLADQERWEEAKAVGREAYQLGYSLQALRRRMAEAGHPLDG